MKSCLITFLILNSFTGIAQIGKNKFEIKGNLGYLSDAHFAQSFSDNLFGHYTNVYSSGMYSIDVLKRIGNSRFLAEVTYGYEQLNAKHKLEPKFRDIFYINNYLVGVKYEFTKRHKYYLYSGAQLGIRTVDQTDFSERPGNRFAYDATFIGVRYGKKLGGFYELGFGAKGFIRVGASLKF